MSENTAQINRARAVKDRHADRLMAIPGVVSVGVGMRQTQGRFTDEIAIVVMVKRKLAPEQVPPAERLPAQLEGVPVDVQEAGEVRAG